MNNDELKCSLNAGALEKLAEYDQPEIDYYAIKECDNCGGELTKAERSKAVSDGFARVCMPCRPIVQQQLNELMEGLASL